MITDFILLGGIDESGETGLSNAKGKWVLLFYGNVSWTT